MSSPDRLAYVFWHRIASDGDAASYEDALTAFQQVLEDNVPPGYRGAAVYRHGAVAWLLGGLMREGSGQLWSRRMTLGPTPEMCVLAGAEVPLPREFGPIHVPMELVWSRARNDAVGSDTENAFQ